MFSAFSSEHSVKLEEEGKSGRMEIFYMTLRQKFEGENLPKPPLNVVAVGR